MLDTTHITQRKRPTYKTAGSKLFTKLEPIHLAKLCLPQYVWKTGRGREGDPTEGMDEPHCSRGDLRVPKPPENLPRYGDIKEKCSDGCFSATVGSCPSEEGSRTPSNFTSARQLVATSVRKLALVSESSLVSFPQQLLPRIFRTWRKSWVSFLTGHIDEESLFPCTRDS